jgi:hypothetical protein
MIVAGQIVDAANMLFGNKQQMHRRVGVNVFENDKGICFV